MENRLKFNIEMPNEIRLLQGLFKENGFKLFLVGGAVRDAFLGMVPKDFDLATDALPDVVENILNKNNFRTLATGKAFGVINVFTENDEFEIATFRTDIGSGRRPDSVEFTTIEGDVKRRDLTINALFFDIETNEIVDLVGGLEDLSKGIVRTVGSAFDRFNEDRLRILRAIRFSARLGCELSDDIKKTLNGHSRLDGISGERIRDEFLKGLKSAKSISNFLKLLHEFNLIRQIFPLLSIKPIRTEERDPIVVIALMLIQNPNDSLKSKLNEAKYKTEEIKAITFLIKLRELSFRNVIILKREQKNAGVSDSQIRNFARLVGISGIFIDLFLLFELSISGPEVMLATGLKPSSELGEEITRLELLNFERLFE